MSKYQNGKIYMIRNEINDMVYIGSTISPLCKRWWIHKSHSSKPYNNSAWCSFYPIIQEHGIDNFYIELYEDYPCNSKAELNRREGEVIREYKEKGLCYNKQISGRTIKEYRTENKKYLSSSTKEWVAKQPEEYHDKRREQQRMLMKEKRNDPEFREKQNAKKREKIECPVCNIEMSRNSLARHKRRFHITNNIKLNIK